MPKALQISRFQRVQFGMFDIYRASKPGTVKSFLIPATGLLARLEGKCDELDAHLTALLFMSRSLSTALSISRPDALAVLVTATDTCNRHMEEGGWPPEKQAQARHALDWLGKAILETS